MSRALAALITTVMVVGPAGCGGSAKPAGSPKSSSEAITLRWERPPLVTTPDTLPNDRVLAGVVENASERPLEVDRDEVKLLDADGRQVFAATRFSSGFGRDIYPPRYGRNLPEAVRLRLGLRASVAPGGSTPVTIAWRVKNASRAPVRLDIGPGELKIPAD